MRNGQFLFFAGPDLKWLPDLYTPLLAHYYRAFYYYLFILDIIYYVGLLLNEILNELPVMKFHPIV